MSTRKQQIKNLKSKFNSQISFLRQYFNDERDKRVENSDEWESLYRNQVNEILSSFEFLISKRQNINLLWENLLEWNLRENSSEIWQKLLLQKEENINRITKHVSINLNSILENELNNKSNSLPLHIKEQMQEEMKNFKDKNKNEYNSSAFSQDLYSFSTMNKEEEIKSISENVETYYFPSWKKKKLERLINKQQSNQFMKDCIDDIIKNKRKEAKKEHDTDFDDYLRVSRDELKIIHDNMLDDVKSFLPERQRRIIFHKTDGATQTRLLRNELNKILSNPTLTYKTDIGIHDDKMQELQNEIDKWQETNRNLIESHREKLKLEKKENSQLLLSEDEIRQQALELRKRFDNAVNEYSFLNELNELSENDLKLEIERKQKLLKQKKEELEQTTNKLSNISNKKYQLEKELKPLLEHTKNLKENLSILDENLSEIIITFENEKRNSITLLSKEVWNAISRFEGREIYNINQERKYYFEFLKNSSEYLNQSILSKLYEGTLSCAIEEGKKFDELSFSVFRNHLSNFLLRSKLREIKLISHLSILKAILDSNPIVKKPDKLLKKQILTLEKKYYQWLKSQEDIDSSFKNSSQIHNQFKLNSQLRNKLDIISNILWQKKEIEFQLTNELEKKSEDNDNSIEAKFSISNIKSKISSLKNMNKNESRKIVLLQSFIDKVNDINIETYKRLEDQSSINNLELNDNEQRDTNEQTNLIKPIEIYSPLLDLTNKLVEEDESVTDSLLMSISQSQHAHTSMISQEQSRAQAIEASIKKCESLRDNLPFKNSIEIPNWNEMLHELEHQHLEKYKIKSSR